MKSLVLGLWSLVLLGSTAGCSFAGFKPLRGGATTTTLGGTHAPTVVTAAAPENPQTPSTTIVEKSTVREFRSPEPDPVLTAEHTDQSRMKTSGSSVPLSVPSVVKNSGALVREVVSEKATTQTGVAQKDTARELGTRLANMRGVMWVGVALLLGGPFVGWKLGWFTNGCIAGAVGLLLVILAQVVPGHEAWFGLGGLLLLPLVAYVYYRARARDDSPATPS